MPPSPSQTSTTSYLVDNSGDPLPALMEVAENRPGATILIERKGSGSDAPSIIYPSNGQSLKSGTMS